MMKLAVLAPVAWRTPPVHYGPWEQIAYNIAEGAHFLGIDVTLFATADSFCSGKLQHICPKGYEEDKNIDPKVAECMHISYLMEQADKFDLIHNNFDFLPLTYSRLIKTPILTTIHGFSSPKIIPVYKRYNDIVNYVSISNADRSGELDYIATVYNGIDRKQFTFHDKPEDYLLFFGRIHHDKGTYEAIEIAKQARRKLIIAGIIQDKEYFKQKVEPYIDQEQIVFAGSAEPEKRDKLLREACALLHPINFFEPFGLSVAESLFCGTPVIAFNKGSMPELVIDGVNGFLVDNVPEAVEKIRDIPHIDRSQCRVLAEERFSLEKMSADYYQVYKQILNI
jgi:glycosyltransferase involved in cell wall biosynthesis